MKNTLLIGLIALSICAFGQTSEKKNNISFGVGTQAYNGDLGNPWFSPKDEWYGIGTLTYSRYLNKSFDLSLNLTSGDYGKCREEDDPEFRPDGSRVLNMLSRLTTGIVTMKYKFANGYILKENAKISPYVYLGGGVDILTIGHVGQPVAIFYDGQGNYRANLGTYASINGGLGVRYNFGKNLNLTYNLGFGYFTTDNIDQRAQGADDMYMQNTLLFGVNF